MNKFKKKLASLSPALLNVKNHDSQMKKKYTSHCICGKFISLLENNCQNYALIRKLRFSEKLIS